MEEKSMNLKRAHIAFFGLRNAGKSSIVNAVTGQQLSIVSDVKGTTTDPVKKAMELLPLGPVVIIDTPGIDDSGTLGQMRVKRTLQILDETDLAVLITDATEDLSEQEGELLQLFCQKKIPHLVVKNKSDLLSGVPKAADGEIYVSAKTGFQVENLKEALGRLLKENAKEKPLVADLIHAGDLVVLVTPIDASAPKGRIILPQQQTIRDVLDAGAMCVVCKDTEFHDTLQKLSTKPALVITDSQVFGKVAKQMPDGVPLTSFSILFARYKGDLPWLVEGAKMLEQLQDGDRVLVCEGCTHHRQCGDIGTVKLPKWVQNFSGKKINFDFVSGADFPEDLTEYRLILHCGGCMLNERQMQSRIERAREQGVSMTNYGTAIAKINGILERALEVFGE